MDTQQERIIRYIDQEMDEAERRGFEAEVQQDPDLAQALVSAQQAIQAMRQWGLTEAARRAAATFEAERAAEPEAELPLPLREAITELGRERLLAQARAAEAAYEQEKAAAAPPRTAKRIPLTRWLAVAASVALLVWVGWQFWGPAAATPAYAHYTQKAFYAPQMARIESDAQASLGFKPLNPQLLQGIQAFNSGDFRAASETLMPYSSEPLAALFIGMAQLEMGYWQQAFEHFRRAQEAEPGPVKSYAQWNLALCYLHFNQRREARSFLETLQTEAHLSQENADLYEAVNQLLDELR